MSLDVVDLLPSGPADYAEVWQLQRELHAEVAAGQRPDTLILLEHANVYTAGKRTEPHERPTDGTPVIDVDRGGKITWHGPGQLVGYPIVRLPDSVLVVDYVRRLEEAIIAMLAGYGLTTGRVRGRSGVWLAAEEVRQERKIAAIGVRVAAGTTMHGFAINVDPDLSTYDKIIPCGLVGVGVTSLAAELVSEGGRPPSDPPPRAQEHTGARELGSPVTVGEVAAALRPELDRLLAFAPYAQSADISSVVELSPVG